MELRRAEVGLDPFQGISTGGAANPMLWIPWLVRPPDTSTSTLRMTSGRMGAALSLELLKMP